MDQKLQKKLNEDFPLLYSDIGCTPQRSCMAFGFEFDDGWEPLIRALSEKLEVLIEEQLPKYSNTDCRFCGCERWAHRLEAETTECFTIHSIAYKLKVPHFWRSNGTMWSTSFQRYWESQQEDKLARLWHDLKFNFRNEVWRVKHEYWGKLVAVPFNKFAEKMSHKGFSKLVPCDCKAYKPNHPRAAQVKEKFGTLRFYMDYDTEEMRVLVREAEDKSATICESCGSSEGARTGQGWIKTLCSPCESKRYD